MEPKTDENKTTEDLDTFLLIRLKRVWFECTMNHPDNHPHCSLLVGESLWFSLVALSKSLIEPLKSVRLPSLASTMQRIVDVQEKKEAAEITVLNPDQPKALPGVRHTALLLTAREAYDQALKICYSESHLSTLGAFAKSVGFMSVRLASWIECHDQALSMGTPSKGPNPEPASAAPTTSEDVQQNKKRTWTERYNESVSNLFPSPTDGDDRDAAHPTKAGLPLPPQVIESVAKLKAFALKYNTNNHNPTSVDK